MNLPPTTPPSTTIESGNIIPFPSQQLRAKQHKPTQPPQSPHMAPHTSHHIADDTAQMQLLWTMGQVMANLLAEAMQHTPSRPLQKRLYGAAIVLDMLMQDELAEAYALALQNAHSTPTSTPQ